MRLRRSRQTCWPKTLQVMSRGLLIAVVLLGLPWNSHAQSQWRFLGIPGATVHSLAFHPANPSIVYAGIWQQGIFRSTDDGDTWTNVNPSLNDPSTALAFDLTNANVIYAGSYYGSGVWKSINGGDTWEAKNGNLYNDDRRIFALATDPAVPTTVYAGTVWYSNRFFRSTDGGENWQVKNAGLPNVTFGAIVIDPMTMPGTVYIASSDDGGGIFKSLDRGETWQAKWTGLTNLRTTSLALDTTDPHTLYAGTYGGDMFRSHDGGDTWQAIAHLNASAITGLAVHPIDPHIIFAGTPQGVFKSEDSGYTWIDVTGNLPVRYVHKVAFHPGNPSKLYAGTAGTGIFVLDGAGPATFTPQIITLALTKNGSGTGSVASDPAGVDCGATCSATFPAGTPVTLTATPDAASTFTSWSGACTGTNPTCVLTMAEGATVTATVPVGSDPGFVALHPDGTRVYVANGMSGSVSVLDTATNTVTATVPVGANPYYIAVHPAGTRVYVANWGSGTVSVLDTATNTVTATVPVGVGHVTGVAVHPTGTWVYVGNWNSNSVFVIDTATNTVTATVPVSAPDFVAMNPTGTRLYVTHYWSNSFSVLDTATNTVMATVPMSSPGDVAVHPAGTRVYVANSKSNSVSVLDTTLSTVTATFTEKPLATLTLGNLTQVYDGTPRAVTVNTTPAGLAVSVTYDGAATPPTAAGSYAVVATLSDPNYQAAPVTGTLVVAKAVPTLVWAAPAAIGYGSPLSATQLNATANVPGAFAYTPAAGTVLPVGSHQLSVSFTPADPANYTGATASVTIAVTDTTPPVIGPVSDLTAEATSAAGAVITFGLPSATDDTSVPTVACTPASGSTFPLDLTRVTCTATDAAGNASSKTFTVTVRDTTPPGLTVPGPITKEATAPLTPVTLGAATAVDLVDGPVAVTSNAPPNGYPVGTTIVTWTAVDSRGNRATKTQQVTITDTTPPTATLSLSPTTLWPPNHKMVTITPTLTASDLSGLVTISGPTVTSNEPVDGLGDGDTSPDWIVTGTYGIQLRAERSGKGDGRIYTVTYTVTDQAGNAKSVSATVTVPKSQGK